MSIEYVDLETAKAARGTRMVTSALVPSLWSEAAKGCFRVARVPVLVVRRGLDTAAIDAWTGIDNVPAVIHDREPVRSNWTAIVALVDRLARLTGTTLLPTDPAARRSAIGVLHEIAGEEGIGWNGRLAMIDAAMTSNGERGFPFPVAKFLAKRYGYSPVAVEAARERIGAQLAFLASELRGDYFGGSAPDAIDVYAATFLTPIAGPITEADCPDMHPMFRAAFTSAYDAFGALVPATLLAHRERMFSEHLPRPIRL
jgi:glutathione S-transferase